jgi:hypothetical protein
MKKGGFYPHPQIKQHVKSRDRDETINFSVGPVVGFVSLSAFLPYAKTH